MREEEKRREEKEKKAIKGKKGRKSDEIGHMKGAKRRRQQIKMNENSRKKNNEIAEY